MKAADKAEGAGDRPAASRVSEFGIHNNNNRVTELNFGRIDLPDNVLYMQLWKKRRGYAGDASDLLEIGLKSSLLLLIA
jgi:hypothetical protein